MCDDCLDEMFTTGNKMCEGCVDELRHKYLTPEEYILLMRIKTYNH